MFRNLCDFLKDNVRLEIFMSVTLLIAMAAIACNMDKVADQENQRESARIEQEKNGKVVVIDPGHGGVDPGKVGSNGTKEKDVNLAISMALKEVLEEEGFEVVMTRTKDEVLSGEGKYSKVGDLKARCQTINDTYAANTECVLVSIHQNSFTQNSVHGAQSFYYQRSEKSMQLAEILQQQLNENINTEKAKKAKPNDSYYMLINSACPGVIVECGFLSNSEEEAKLTDATYQRTLAEVIAKGLKAYFF